MSKYENVQELVGYIRDEYIRPNQLTYVEVESIIRNDEVILNDIIKRAKNIIRKDDDVEESDKVIITKLLLKSIRKRIIQLEKESISFLKSERNNNLSKYNKICSENPIYLAYADIVIPDVIIDSILKIPPRNLIEESEKENTDIKKFLYKKTGNYLNSFMTTYPTIKNINHKKKNLIISRVLSNDKILNRERMLLNKFNNIIEHAEQIKKKACNDKLQLYTLYAYCEKEAKEKMFKGNVELLKNSIKITVNPEKFYNSRITSITIGISHGYRFIYIDKGDKLKNELKLGGTTNEIDNIYLSKIMKDISKNLTGVFKTMIDDTAYAIKNLDNMVDNKLLSEV